MALIPRTDLDVFGLCLGGNVFGWTANRDESFAVLDAYAAAGGNFVDTADVYMAGAPGNSGGESETIIGEWLAARPGKRDDFVIATKVGKLPGLDNLRAETIRKAADDSLKRLGVEHDRPLLRPLRRPGHAAGGDARGVRRADRGGQGPPHRRLQLLRRAADRGARDRRARGPAPLRRPAAALQPDGARLRVRPAGGLRARGHRLLPLLRPRQRLPHRQVPAGRREDRQRPRRRRLAVPGRARRKDARARSTRSPRRTASQPAAVAVAWLREQPTVLAPIASARNEKQLEPLIASASLELTSDELEQLSSI